MDDLRVRVERLETDVGAIRADVGEIKGQLKAALPTLATKAETLATSADMHKEFNLQTWRIIGGILAAAGLLLAGLRLIG